jgi:hypothetical protein
MVINVMRSKIISQQYNLSGSSLPYSYFRKKDIMGPPFGKFQAFGWLLYGIGDGLTRKH